MIIIIKGEMIDIYSMFHLKGFDGGMFYPRRVNIFLYCVESVSTKSFNRTS